MSWVSDMLSGKSGGSDVPVKGNGLFKTKAKIAGKDIKGKAKLSPRELRIMNQKDAKDAGKKWWG